ncbi:MAG: aminoglycoside phosphotransferase family protein [Firmicutes bacterium]|nr:aminoglycoside phosphotransferase family protein [Bacillota bacterium]
MIYNEIKHVIRHFRYTGEYRSVREIASGNVNVTYRLTFRQSDGSDIEYILQRINTVAFRDPVELMKNILLVCDHITASMARAHLDTSRRIMEFISADNGSLLYRDAAGNYWRSYLYIGGCTAYDGITEPRQFYEAGRGFGEFQKFLFDFPTDKLVETIPGFHDTRKRFYTFVASVAADKVGRAKGLDAEIDFFFDRRKMMSSIVDLMADGTIPTRVTHNDTKLNNVLIDDATGKAICVIDLDTVMPGSALYDYGDAIRYGASTAPEDETDLDKIHIDMNLFRVFTDGFVSEVAGALTRSEIHNLPLGIKVITCELAMRFLTDYLDGDLYFKIRYPRHNLDRARAQMRLLEEVESHFDEMTAYVDSLIPDREEDE